MINLKQGGFNSASGYRNYHAIYATIELLEYIELRYSSPVVDSVSVFERESQPSSRTSRQMPRLFGALSEALASNMDQLEAIPEGFLATQQQANLARMSPMKPRNNDKHW